MQSIIFKVQTSGTEQSNACLIYFQLNFCPQKEKPRLLSRRRMEVTESEERYQGGGRSEETQLDGGVSSDSSPGFQYSFNREGRLLHRDTREPFLFRFRRGVGAQRSQTEQEALGRYITQSRAPPPGGAVPSKQGSTCPPPCQGLIFLSQGGAREQQHAAGSDPGPGGRCGADSGAGRPSVGKAWRRAARVPYVRRGAAGERWGVALLDPNEAGASPEEHVRHAWNGLLAGAAAGKVAVVTQRAHSRKWVLSSKPVNRPVGSLKAECPQLSAGTLNHDTAPASCMESVFRYITKALKAKALPIPYDIITRSKSQGRSPGGSGQASPWQQLMETRSCQ
ncbi:hypothetical protein SKAU_G00331090 [Synaphobranchus kaupii]|uniref:Uncharacterized protein n=1 Tax=Synaphobranchus kaupii TaxID=118154 RepID=A0A9Q1EL82_SYNKA|nr:hypothetical protein SKAU_G00331090 [Synaphobranchus kaupii]